MAAAAAAVDVAAAAAKNVGRLIFANSSILADILKWTFISSLCEMGQ